MIYTQQRRRALNKALRSLYHHITFHESANGIPVMTCKFLPDGARRIADADEFVFQVSRHCRRQNEMGTYVSDYNKVLPVFILSMELDGSDTHFFYRVNYVSVNECSLRKAVEYISEGKLFAVMK